MQGVELLGWGGPGRLMNKNAETHCCIFLFVAGLRTRQKWKHWLLQRRWSESQICRRHWRPITSCISSGGWMLNAPGGSADDDDPKQAPKRNCKHSATATRSIGLQVNCRIFQVDQVSVPKMINNGGMEDEVMVIRDRHESHKSKGLTIHRADAVEKEGHKEKRVLTTTAKYSGSSNLRDQCRNELFISLFLSSAMGC